MHFGKKIQALRKSKGLTQEELAMASGVKYATLTKLEGGAIKNPSLEVIQKLTGALDSGIDALLQFNKDEGSSALKKLFVNIIQQLKDLDDPVVLISGVDESKFLDVDKKGLLAHLKRMKRFNIREKILIKKGSMRLAEAETAEYRTVPTTYFGPAPMYIYANTVSFVLWEPTLTVVRIENEHFAESARLQFDFIWKSVKKGR